MTAAQDEVRELASWIPPIVVSGPGKYRVVLHYINDPHFLWRGIPIRGHDAVALELVRKSTPCDVISDPIEIDVRATAAISENR